MIPLSKSAINYAIDVCQEISRCKIGIVIHNPDERGLTQTMMCDTLLNHDSVERINTSRNNFYIWFKNGSIIRVINPSDNARGNRFHLLIVDDHVPTDIIQNVLRCCETISWCRDMQRGK
jgi:hypothetical protein